MTAAVAFLSLGVTGCGKHEKPNFIYMPDMYWSPGVKPQGPGFRTPVAGTIPRGYTPYPFKGHPELAGKGMINPLKRTSAVLARGQDRFNIYCIVCHGAQGMGNGSVVPKYPHPPSLHSDKVRNWADGDIYHVITNGQNIMPSYASQISQADRWAIIHYVRAIQRAQKPSAEDVKAAEQE